MKKRHICIAALLLYLVGTAPITLYYATPTTGAPIPTYEAGKTALLLVDLQQDCIGESAAKGKRYTNESELIAHTSALIAQAQTQGMEVIFTNQEFEGAIGTLWSNLMAGGRLKAGSEGAKTATALSTAGATLFSKPKGDAFSNKRFEEYLAGKRINRLVIAGVDGQYCVNHTIQGALSRGYAVSVVTDAVGFINKSAKEKTLAAFADKGVTRILSNQFGAQ